MQPKPVALEYRKRMRDPQRCAVIRERKHNHISLSQAGPPPAHGVSIANVNGRRFLTYVRRPRSFIILSRTEQTPDINGCRRDQAVALA